jgi:hypothetical protein
MCKILDTHQTDSIDREHKKFDQVGNHSDELRDYGIRVSSSRCAMEALKYSTQQVESTPAEEAPV